MFGGTFDPFHLGHLHLAVLLYEKAGLDEVRFIPAQRNPLKKGEGVSIDHRIKMIELAIQDIPFLSVDLIEAERPGPSYTVDTLRLLKQKEPNSHFFWMMGEDAAFEFSKWHKPEEIVEMADLLIGSRSDVSKISFDDPRLAEAIKKGWVQTPCFDISATEVRNRLVASKSCRHLLDHEIVDYIALHRLYS